MMKKQCPICGIEMDVVPEEGDEPDELYVCGPCGDKYVEKRVAELNTASAVALRIAHGLLDGMSKDDLTELKTFVVDRLEKKGDCDDKQEVG